MKLSRYKTDEVSEPRFPAFRERERERKSFQKVVSRFLQFRENHTLGGILAWGRYTKPSL